MNKIETSNGSIALVPQESDYAVIEITQEIPTNSYAYTYLDASQLMELRDMINLFLVENDYE